MRVDRVDNSLNDCDDSDNDDYYLRWRGLQSERHPRRQSPLVHWRGSL